MQKRIALLYGTTEGQSAKIAHHMAHHLRVRGADAAAMHLAELPLDYDPVQNSDAFVVIASVHQGVHQRYVADFARTHATLLNERPSAFLSVSLQAAFGAGEEATQTLEDFLRAAGWTPTMTLCVPGALRYTSYNWLKQLVMRSIAKERGEPTNTGEDVEYTDFGALDAFADDFLQKL